VPARPTEGDNGTGQQAAPHNLETICNLLHVTRTNGRTLIESIPFAPGDVTAGCENELQAVVVGGERDVDPHRMFGEVEVRGINILEEVDPPRINPPLSRGHKLITCR